MMYYALLQLTMSPNPDCSDCFIKYGNTKTSFQRNKYLYNKKMRSDTQDVHKLKKYKNVIIKN